MDAFLNARQRPFEDKYGLGRVMVAGLGIGVVAGIHIVLLLQHASTRIIAWSMYALTLCTFHLLEFVSTALFKWRDLSYNSFLINHSKAYYIAIAASVLEYVVEPFDPPSYSIGAGLFLVVSGQSLRFLAMATAREHFAHRIMMVREKEHRLITHGVYSVLRHPAYTGWFWWSIGTQLVLANPICFFGYAWASWSFFRDRIPFEENTLAAFYPDQYPDYVKRTWVAIPFIPGGLDEG